MEYKSQFGEDKIIHEFFVNTYGESFRGNILDVGANDGISISNSYAFIKEGWTGVLIEPGKTPYSMLAELYNGNPLVKIHNFALSETNGTIEFYESFSNDPWSQNGLVSSTIENETSYWKDFYNVSYEKYNVNSFDYQTFINEFYTENQIWDLISIDIEGLDFDLLKQIDLIKCECKCLVVEYNGKNMNQFVDYCRSQNMYLYRFNDCNLIFVKNVD